MRNLTAAIATILLMSPALAQNTGSAAKQNNQAQEQQNPTASQQQPTDQIAQQIRTNLQKAGFKNIKLMPSSFLVRATDQDNHPVMMVINPDSVTEVSTAQGGNTTGQSTGDQQNNMPSSGTTNKPNR